MKILAACVFGCAMMVLATAAFVPDAKAKNNQTVSLRKSVSCSHGWSDIMGRCFHYVPKVMTWADAERYCQSMDANLASVHNFHEYHGIQKLILTVSHDNKQAWVGGSDAQQENVWLWSDGSKFIYTDWCAGEPNSLNGPQHCLQINHNEKKCWDDVECRHKIPFVCKKKEQ